MSCKRSQEFLATNDIPVGETVIANKEKLGPDEALALARAASEVWVSKGKKVVRLSLKKDKPTDDELLKLILGPTGNLRAPVAKVGRKLLVGFSQEAYEQNLL